ncbi:MAG: T9SS type A sorting domain-containing protein, partial [Bacteroidota bacterium]|nr:T9SS type A sorting domain-containing protein [Bacteroidota bacterium]
IARMSDSTQLYKFMAYSLKSKDTLMGNDGAVLHLYLTVPDTVRSYTIDLKKAVLVDTSATAADITLTDGKLSILPVYYIGDSDGDEQVNVTDIVWLVAWINGKNPDGFQKEAADMDGNGSWNVVDVVKLVDLINATVSSSKVAVRRTETDDAKVYNAKAAGKTNHVYLCQSETDAATVDLCLDNIDGVQALQVDMVLSSGIAVETSTAELLSDRSDGHVISFKCVSAAENRYRLLVWSLRTDNPLKGNTGPVVRFKVQTSSEKETDTLTGKLQDAVLTGMDRKAVNSETYMTKLDFSTTGGQLLAKAGSDAKGRLWVSGDKLKEIGVYDLAGRLSAKVIDPEEELIYLPVSAGVYLVRVKQEGQSLSVMKVLVP